MREVGIHLDDVFIAVLKRPLKSGNVGCAKPLLAGSLQQIYPLGILCNKSLNDCRRAVGRIVVNNQYVELVLSAKHCSNNVANVLLFVVGGYDNHAIAFHIPLYYFCSLFR